MNLVASVFRIPIFFRMPGKLPLSMRCLLPIVLLLLSSICSSAQSISLTLDNAPIETAFNEIRKQTGYSFIYTRDQLEQANKVTLSVSKKPLSTVLDLCFKNQPLIYHVEDNYIIVRDKPKTTTTTVTALLNLMGRVTDDKGVPLAGATVTVKQTGRTIICDEDGTFSLAGIESGSVISISNIGFEKREMKVSSDAMLNIELTPSVNSLDETLVIAYGTTTKKLNTGSVSKVTGAEIERQPVNNLLATLHGRVPGMTVVQQNGIPGSAVKIQIRGRTSINSNINNDPLIVIDGVPFAPNNNSINQVNSAAGSGGLSPFNSINPADIESIEVLRDADATSIYGSRGANGVILITTKKGKAGKSKVDLSIRSGWSKVTRTMPFMNTQQYVQMRKEAFSNDGIVPSATPGSPGYAPDLMIWDTTSYTDLRKLLIGGTARFNDMQLRFSGGNALTQFSIGSGFTHQTTVFPGKMYDARASVHVNLTHRSVDQKFSLSLKSSYVYDNNHISTRDITSSLRLPPIIPALYDADGKLNWQKGGATFENPLAVLQRAYNSKTHNLLTSMQLSYQLTPTLTARASIGYNSVSLKDQGLTPISSQNPSVSPVGSASFGNNDFRSIIVEPQLEYKRKFNRLKINILAGGSWQKSTQEGLYLIGSGYTNDALIRSLRGAATVTIVRSDEIVYKYAAAFGRLNLNWDDRFIANLTGRRDGSSRFGPAHRFANFGAAGIAWIFSKEGWMRQAMPVLSFGKLRMSYGTTGNDKIGDYAYLNTFSTTGLNYQGNAGLVPTTLFNPDYAWEMNKKLEAAIETGFFKDRLQVSIAYYRNESGNQLINYSLPAQTGGQSIIANFPATVVNSGWEIQLSGTLVSKKDFEWTLSGNISVPKNRLASFPGLESSSYGSLLVIGKSLNIVGGYRYAGVDPQTGLFEFYDKDKVATTAPLSSDRVKDLLTLDPDFYGGLSSTLKYKQWNLEIFTEFKKQQGLNYFGSVYSTAAYPGTMFNMPAILMNRWRTPGDDALIQKYTRGPGSAAYAAAGNITNGGSDLQYGDASYLRLKNVMLSYSVPLRIIKRIRAQQVNCYIQGQNLVTITGYEGADPETQNLFTLPPLKTFACGVQITF